MGGQLSGWSGRDAGEDTLTGVFDPPPEAMSVPWSYLVVLGVACVISTTVALTEARIASRHSVD
ncbi:MAG: hypothetical protein IVW55_13470 [Chloroflexi bacterium]|nr:hypothetical protein [Chloroflexota bacterium]